jgi:hypothetical protein
MTPPDHVAESRRVHASFVRRLTNSPTGGDGDDLAQDVWSAALQHDATRRPRCARLARGAGVRGKRNAQQPVDPWYQASLPDLVAPQTGLVLKLRRGFF